LGKEEDEQVIIEDTKSRLFRSIPRPFKRGSFPIGGSNSNNSSRKSSAESITSSKSSLRSSPKHLSRGLRSGSSNRGQKHDLKPLKLSTSEIGTDIKKRDRRHSRGAKSQIYMLFSPSLKDPVEIVDHDREMFVAIRRVLGSQMIYILILFNPFFNAQRKFQILMKLVTWF